MIEQLKESHRESEYFNALETIKVLREEIERLKNDRAQFTERSDRAVKTKLQHQAENQELRALLAKAKTAAYQAVLAEMDAADKRMNELWDGVKLMFSPKLNEAEMHSLKEFFESKRPKRIKIAPSDGA